MNEAEIKRAFAKDYFIHTPEALFREWFSINGGKTLGHGRLGYYIGDLLFQHEVDRVGEQNTIIAWKNDDFEARAMD